MKRSKLLLVALLVLLLSVVGACDTAHFHDYGKWAITTEPTLESEGVYSQGCECGITVEKKIPALSDESVWALTETVEPTHFLEGKMVYESIYGTVVVAIPTIAHVYGEEYTIVTDPTTDNTGFANHSCECGNVETIEIPALSDESVWTLTETVKSTHLKHGKSTYTSLYGTVVVTLDLVPHEYGDYSITSTPTLTDKGGACRVCHPCGTIEFITIPALSNEDVWTLTVTPATHLATGLESYVSIYGTVEIVLDVIPHDFGDYTLSVNPTLTDVGSAFHSCEGCGTIEFVEVPALSDATVWSVERTVAPDYNNKGEDTYTSIYGVVKVEVAKLVVVYDGKTYAPINFDAYDDAWKNGVVQADGVWSNASISLNADGVGIGTAYPFRGAYKFTMVNVATGEILISKYEQLVEEVWVPDEETWDPEDGSWVKQGVVDEDGNPVYDWTKPVESYTAWLDSASGLILAPRYVTFDDVNLYTPFEVGFASGSATASAWDNAIAINYSINGNDYTVFVYDGRAYFGVSFVDLNGVNVNAADCYSASNLIVLDSNGAVIKAFAHNGNKLVISDGVEGEYTCGSDVLFLNGCGTATLNGASANYVIDGDVIGLYVNGEYHEVTLNGNAYTSVKPMVTITFDTDGKADVDAVTVNKNIEIVLPAPTHEAFTFKGWLTADGTAVDSAYVPTQSTTLYANWKAKVVVNLAGVLDGDSNVIYLGEGDVIGSFLPAYGVEESVGKVFRGWYLDAEFNTTLAEDAELSEEDTGVTIYAKWEDLPVYYGTYYGGELYSTSNTYSTLYKLSIDENGIYTNSASTSKSGIIVGYDPATQIITWKKNASDTTIYYLWFDEESGILVAPYSNGTKMNQDIYIGTKHNNVVVRDFYAIKIALSATDSTRGLYGRVVGITTNEGYETIFVSNERIYPNVTIKDVAGNDLDHVSVKNSKTMIVTNLDTNTVVASVASKGASFYATSDTVDLDAYFGTYVNGAEAVVLDGVGGIVYGDKSGTYTAVEGKDYGFDVYFNNNTEYYQLTLNGDSFVIVKPMANVTLNTQFGTTETVSVNVNVAYVLPVLTHETNVFNGWYFDKAFTNAVGDSVIVTADTNLYALWKVKKVLTIVYNNGEENDAIEYSEGDVANLDVPVYAKHAFVGWFTTETFEAGSEWANGSEITTSLTIYAKWEAAPIYNATYVSFEIDRYEGNGGVSGLYARNATISIDPYGHAPKGSSWPFASGEINVKNFNAETGYIELHVGTSYVFWGYIDLVSGIMVLSDVSGVTSTMKEIIVMSPFETKLSTSSFSSSYWALGMVRTIEYTFNGTVYSALVMNNQVYFGVSFKDADGNSVVAKDCFGVDTLFVYGADNSIVAKYGFDGTTMQLMDGFEGTYSSNMGEVKVNGVKTITLGGVNGEYFASSEGAEYSHYAFVDGCYYEITLDKDTYTAVVNKPMVTITFDAGVYATVEAVTVNKNIEITLPTPANEAFIFRGWYIDTAFENAVDTEYVPIATCTLYAKWDAKVSLTVVYGNGMDEVVLYYGVGDVTAPVTPAYTNGLVFDGWYLDADYATEYTVGAIIENTTIYCKWKEAVAAFGSYKGFNLFGSGNKSTTYIGSSLTIEVDGKVTGTKSGTFTDYDSATGTAKIGSIFAVYNEELGILATPYGSNSTTLGTDMYLFFKDAPAKVEQSADLTDSGYTKLLKVTRQDGTSYVVLVMNDRILAVESWETTDGSVASEQYVKDRTSSFIVTLTNGQVLTFTKSGGYFTVA